MSSPLRFVKRGKCTRGIVSEVSFFSLLAPAFFYLTGFSHLRDIVTPLGEFLPITGIPTYP